MTRAFISQCRIGHDDMPESEIGHQRACSAGDDEASTAECDQLFQPPRGERRTYACEGDSEPLPAVVDLEDGMASHFRLESPDLRTAEFGYKTRDCVLEEAEHERLWDIERRDRPGRVDDRISRRIELHERELVAGHVASDQVMGFDSRRVSQSAQGDSQSAIFDTGR